MTDFVTSKQALDWLAKDVIPLWSTRGFNFEKGYFFESLSREGEPLQVPCRVMVQARQIYSFVEAWRLKLISQEQARALVEPAVHFLVGKYSLPSGAFAHSVGLDGEIAVENPDLYAQSFAIFGLAQAFVLTGQSQFRDRAKKCLAYLQRERRAKSGGYTELVQGQLAFQSNPHMHLFEAALAWIQADRDKDWLDFAHEIYELCQTKFIDLESSALCEKFDQNWLPLRENGHFVFEPGHHYEWAWLMLEFQKLTSTKVGQSPSLLFETAETCGIHPQNKLAIDEVWSNRSPKKTSSRFWPQGERIKAAVALGKMSVADQALTGLFRFLNSPARGLWEDTLTEQGQFTIQPIKASSLYHIINAISEYVQKR